MKSHASAGRVLIVDDGPEKRHLLLILPQDVLDRARVVAGKATTTLKLPVSLQIVRRALIEEGLKRDGDRTLLANVEGQAVRRIRSRAGKGGGADGDTPVSPVGTPAKAEREWAAEAREGEIGGSDPATRGVGANGAPRQANVTVATADCQRRCQKEAAMWKWVGVTIVATVVAAMSLGCSQQPPSAPTVVIEDKVYTVTPASMMVKAGIVTGDVTEMKVTERVEKGSGRLVSPAKLTGKLVLKNSSTNQTIRLVVGKILYIDAQGQPIKLEEARTEPTIKFATYGAETLDPGKDATQSLDVDFPAEALKAKKLKEIRLELAYIPSPYKEETINFTVAIGGQ